VAAVENRLSDKMTDKRSGKDRLREIPLTQGYTALVDDDFSTRFFNPRWMRVFVVRL
jgi:hypothetical protein